MKKILLTLSLVLMTILSFGQTPLPNDPETRTGKLANGMTYYIRHNAIPEGRAEFYLATRVGAIQETPDQDGLAHFLEHMCFNGLKNLPGKQMLEYLQHIGAEFGRNINASTGVEVTQYMLNNMPIHREGIIDTCLLVMHDYSHFVLNEESEIEAERGVILEEKRTRNNAGWRMHEKSAPYYYGPSSKYAGCTIIGSEENLKNFKPESLRNFYKTWYQPDMQAIVVVGDIDPDMILGKIEKLFADIPAPEQPTVKQMYEVEVNSEPVVGILTDPENTNCTLEFIWKLGQPIPREMNGTLEAYMDRLVKSVIYQVMSERFSDITAKADAPFLDASYYIGSLCQTSECIMGDVTCKNGTELTAATAFLTEVERLKRYGITDDELGRVKENMIKSCKDRVAGKSTRKNPQFIRPILNHFFNGISYLDPEMELQMAEALASQINAAAINQVLPALFSNASAITILYKGVDQPGQVHPTEEQLLACAEAAAKAEIEAPTVEAINIDLMQSQKNFKPGKVKKEAAGDYSSVVWTLGNGVKVVVKPTDYKKDEVTFKYVKNGGMSLIPLEDLDSFDSYITMCFESAKGISSFNNSTLGKMLTGTNVSVSPFINDATNGFNGSCSPEDMETALQLIYLSCADPRFDEEEWKVAENQIAAYLPNLISTPNYALNQHVYADVYDSPRAKFISTETLEKANLETYKKYYNRLFSDAAGATLYITGNVDIESLKPMVAKYIGAIAKGKKANSIDESQLIDYKKGKLTDVFATKMNTPKVTVIQVYTADIAYDVQKAVNLDIASFILDMIYTSTLREEEGGTYGASSYMNLSYFPRHRALVQVAFDTNVEQQEKLRELAIKGINQLANEGPTEEQMTRAIENAKKNLPEKRITNGYWQRALEHNAILGGDYDSAYEAAIANISAEGVKAVLQEILAAGNFCEIVMTPEM